MNKKITDEEIIALACLRSVVSEADRKKVDDYFMKRVKGKV